MPRLRNARTGVVVNVSEEMAATLGSEWKPIVRPDPPKPAPRRRRSKASDDEV